MWSAILGKLKEILSKMVGSRTIQDSLNVVPLISKEMEAAINLWSQMYINKAPWIKEPDSDDPVRIASLGLPAMIASEKARMVLLEFQSEITTPTEEVEVENPDYTEPEPDEFGNIVPTFQTPTIIEDKPVGDTSRAEYLNKQYVKLKEKLRTQLEYGIAKGGLVIKPRLVFNAATKDNEQTEQPEIEFDFIQADNFYPIAFDANGNIIEAAFIQSIQDKTTVYSRLEYHKFKGNSVEVINKAYKSTNVSTDNGINNTIVNLGKEIPLSDVPQWKDLQEKTRINNVYKPLFAYFKMPGANTIDTTSPLGVSGYSRAVNLIKDADMQYSRLLWEYEAGEMAIDIDRDAIKFTEYSPEDGRPSVSVRPYLQNRLFRKIDISSTGDTYQPYAPALRDTAYIQGLNNMLMRIEDIEGISRGTLSDAAVEARTATELKTLKQRSYCSIAEIQHALENALKDTIYISDVYCDLYEITPDGEYDVSFEWDDSILVDVETELNKKILLMQNGLMSKLEVRQWYFGETKRQAQQALLDIESETMQDMENEMVMQGNAQRQEQEIQNKGGFNK